MAEGPQRQVRAVDVVAVPVRAPARRLVRVVDRDLADVAGHGDRELAARVGVAEEDVGDRGGALVAGHPRVEDRGRALRPPRGCASGRPATSTSTTGVPVAATAATSSSWRPGSPSSMRSRISPHVQSSVSPERSPTTTIATSAPRAASAASAISASLASRMPPPAREADLGAARAALADGVEDRRAALELVGQVEVVGDREADRVVAHLEQRLDVGDVRVVAQEVARAVGVGADDGDRRAGRRAAAASRRSPAGRSRRARASRARARSASSGGCAAAAST